MALTELARDDVLDAIGECRVMGQQAFLEHYGYGPAAEYLLEYEGGYYDSKAIVGAAHQRVTGQRLEHLSGGLSQTVPFLKRLGFNVTRRSEGLSVAGNNVTSMSSNGVWWVNQSESFDRAIRGGYLWAPARTSNNRTRPDWEAALNSLQVGDTVIHYAEGHVRAISTVTGTATPATRPDPIADAVWGEQGNLARVSPQLLDSPVPLHALPKRPVSTGPFDRNGDIVQGYLYPLPESYSAELLDFLHEKGLKTVAGTATPDAEDLAEAQKVITTLAPEDKVIPPEQVHAAGTTYTSREREVIVDRAEALLVQAYRESLTGFEVSGLACATGRPDLVVSNHTDTEMIEAKSRANHAKVREALGQILDYCHNTTTQFTRVTALFPHTPAEGDVAMLHRYGIDVLHRDNVGAFHRNPAPEAARLVWSATPFPTSAPTPSTTAITLPQRPTPQPPGSPAPKLNPPR